MRITRNGEKLYLLGLTILGLVFMYLGWLELDKRRNPPPDPHPYIWDIYKGK